MGFQKFCLVRVIVTVPFFLVLIGTVCPLRYKPKVPKNPLIPQPPISAPSIPLSASPDDWMKEAPNASMLHQFSNASKSSTNSSADAFSEQGFSKKFTPLGAAGQAFSSNLTNNGFVQQKSQDAQALQSKFDMTKFTNGTADLEQKFKSVSGGNARSDSRSEGSESSGWDVAPEDRRERRRRYGRRRRPDRPRWGDDGDEREVPQRDGPRSTRPESSGRDDGDYDGREVRPMDGPRKRRPDSPGLNDTRDDGGDRRDGPRRRRPESSGWDDSRDDRGDRRDGPRRRRPESSGWDDSRDDGNDRRDGPRRRRPESSGWDDSRDDGGDRRDGPRKGRPEGAPWDVAPDEGDNNNESEVGRGDGPKSRRPGGAPWEVGPDEDDDDEMEVQRRDGPRRRRPRDLVVVPKVPSKTTIDDIAGGSAKTKTGAKKSKKEDDADEDEVNDPSNFSFRNDVACREAFGGGEGCSKELWQKCRTKKCPGKDKEPVYCLRVGESIYKCHLVCMRGPCGEGGALDEANFTKPESKVEREGKCVKKSSAVA